MATSAGAARPASGRRFPDDLDDWNPGQPTKHELRRDASGYDRAYREAYEAGERGDELPDEASPEAREAHAAGRADAARPRRPSRAGRRGPLVKPNPRKAPPPLRQRVLGPKGSTIKVSGGGAGLILGMVGYAVGINWLRYGWPGVTGWFSAKFFNQVTIGGAPGGSGTHQVLGGLGTVTTYPTPTPTPPIQGVPTSSGGYVTDAGGAGATVVSRPNGIR